MHQYYHGYIADVNAKIFAIYGDLQYVIFYCPLILYLVCTLLVHKKCHEDVITSCGDRMGTQSLIDRVDKVCICSSYSLCYTIKIISLKLSEGAQRFSFNVPHRFRVHNYIKPTFCTHCGSMLWRRGLKCEGTDSIYCPSLHTYICCVHF